MEKEVKQPELLTEQREVSEERSGSRGKSAAPFSQHTGSMKWSRPRLPLGPRTAVSEKDYFPCRSISD